MHAVFFSNLGRYLFKTQICYDMTHMHSSLKLIITSIIFCGHGLLDIANLGEGEIKDIIQLLLLTDCFKIV